MYISKQKLKQIIENNPTNSTPEEIVNELVKSGAEIEGYNQKIGVGQRFVSEVAKPFVQAGDVLRSGVGAIGSTIKAGYQTVTGDKEAGIKTLSDFVKKEEQRKKQPLKSVGVEIKRVETPKQAIGLGLNLASNVVGGSGGLRAGKELLKTGIKQSIKTGALTGLKAGSMYGAGEALIDDRNILTGAIGGGIAGGVVGGVLPIVGAGLKVATSPFSTAINKIAPKLERMAQKIETTVLKPSKTDISHGFKIENIGKYNVGGNLKQSYEKTQLLIDDLVNKAELMRSNSKSNIDLNKIVSSVADELSGGKISNIGNNKRIFNAFKTFVRELEDISPDGKMNSVDAQKVKVALGKMGSWLNGQRDLDANANEAVANALYTKFKTAIEKSVDDPKELQSINNQLSELIPIQNVIIKRIPVADRNSALSLTDIITAGTGTIDPKGWGLFAVNRLSKSGQFANILQKSATKLKSGATKLLPLETKAKSYIKNIKPGLTIEDVSKKPLVSKTEQNNIKSFIDKAYKEAPLAKQEIDSIGSEIAKKYNGKLSSAPLKKQEKVLFNINNKYNGDYSRVSDIARNTIIVSQDDVAKVFKEIQKNPNYFGGKFVDPKTDPLGYSGYNTKYRASNGHIAEIQINTPEMIYAKEPAESAIKQLGEKLYNELNKKYNGIGGKGHLYYDDWAKARASQNIKEANKIEKTSSNYYNLFR